MYYDEGDEGIGEEGVFETGGYFSVLWRQLGEGSEHVLGGVGRVDHKRRKILSMNGVFHMGSDYDRLYMRRVVNRRVLISVDECVQTEELGLSEYVQEKEEWMLTVVTEGAEKKRGNLMSRREWLTNGWSN